MKGQKKVVLSAAKEEIKSVSALGCKPTVKYDYCEYSEVREYNEMLSGCDWRDYYEASK